AKASETLPGGVLDIRDGGKVGIDAFHTGRLKCVETPLSAPGGFVKPSAASGCMTLRRLDAVTPVIKVRAVWTLFVAGAFLKVVDRFVSRGTSLIVAVRLTPFVVSLI